MQVQARQTCLTVRPQTSKLLRQAVGAQELPPHLVKQKLRAGCTSGPIISKGIRRDGLSCAMDFFPITGELHLPLFTVYHFYCDNERHCLSILKITVKKSVPW